MRGPALAPLVVLLLAFPVAEAQAATLPVLVERTDAGGLVADVGASATAEFSLFNLNANEDFYVSAAVASRDGWTATIAPNKFFLQPRNATLVSVAFTPDRAPDDTIAFEVTFNLVASDTGTVTKVVEIVEVASGAPPRVLGVFPNPLGPPLDNAVGTFLLDILFWTAISVGAILAGDALVRSVTARASSTVTREIVAKLRRPIFYFVFFFGLARSVRVLPRNPFVDFIERFALGIAVGIFGLYVLYRVLDSALFYYQQEIAPRTNTRMDDVLIPVMRKVGIVVLYVVGVILTLRTLGWDPTIVFAGAGIAGLVIAFAAQDTISNLFSGVFLMLDQPFVEGDDIQLESGETARVETIGLRSTRLYNYRTHEVIVVPNNQLASKRIINHTGPDRRYWGTIKVGASYASDPERVRTVLLRVAQQHPMVLREPGWEPRVRFENFGESSLDFVLAYGLKDFRDRFEVASALRFQIKKAFETEGIEIPFPQRTLWIKQADAAALASPKR